MNTRKNMAAILAATAALTLSACDSMSRQDKYVAGGAVAGGVVGHAVSDGSTLGTVGGAVLGGLAGNEIEKRKDKRERRDRYY